MHVCVRVCESRALWRERSVDAGDAKCAADDAGSATSGEWVDGDRVAGGDVVWRGDAGAEAEYVRGLAGAAAEFDGPGDAAILGGSVYELICLLVEKSCGKRRMG